MADVFELELADIHDDPSNRANDSDDDIIEIDDVSRKHFNIFLFRILFFGGLSLVTLSDTVFPPKSRSKCEKHSK